MDTDEAQIITDVLQGWGEALTDKRKTPKNPFPRGHPPVVLPVSSIGDHWGQKVSPALRLKWA
ncbi:hypothetical protein IAD21_04647 [Abditibacteriota bacterium]|nr:hypothetical protein IAD21_04647 [Abditibacteriota bacterium]